MILVWPVWSRNGTKLYRLLYRTVLDCNIYFAINIGCATLKDVVDYYRSHGSYVFVCFLDLSKAFDSVDHTCLFKELVKLKLPDNVVKLLINWYSNQLMNVRWKQIQSDSFYIKNGIRQGIVSYRLICSRCTCVVLLKTLFRLVLVVILVTSLYVYCCMQTT